MVYCKPIHQKLCRLGKRFTGSSLATQIFCSSIPSSVPLYHKSIIKEGCISILSLFSLFQDERRIEGLENIHLTT